MPTTRSQTVGRTRSATAKRNQQRQKQEEEEKESKLTGRKRAISTSGEKSRKRTRTGDAGYSSERSGSGGRGRKMDKKGNKVKESKLGVLKNEETRRKAGRNGRQKQVTFKKESDVKEEMPEKAVSVKAGDDFQKKHGVLERGHIYFFYRPKVEQEEISSIDDVAKFSFLLIPRAPKDESELTAPQDNKDAAKREGSVAPSPAPQDNPKEFFRYIVVGKKHLPKAESRHEVFWATVADVGNDLSDLDQGLEEQVYLTKTRGERHKGSVRPAGRGVYSILSPSNPSLPASKRDRSYLFYILTHPDFPTEVQSQLGIEKSSSFLLQVKNPVLPALKGVGLKPERRAKYPEEGTREAFGGGPKVEQRKFGPVNPVTFMDYEGTELLLIGDKKNANEVVGGKSDEELERAATEEAEQLDTLEVMRELVMDTEKFPRSAIEGQWI